MGNLFESMSLKHQSANRTRTDSESSVYLKSILSIYFKYLEDRQPTRVGSLACAKESERCARKRRRVAVIFSSCTSSSMFHGQQSIAICPKPSPRKVNWNRSSGGVLFIGAVGCRGTRTHGCKLRIMLPSSTTRRSSDIDDV